MANWCEGTLKIRGQWEDVLRFFREGVDSDSAYDGVRIYDHDSDYVDLHIAGEPWVKGSRRAFIGPDEDLYIDKDGEQIVFCPMRQAWSIKIADWEQISKRYNIDIRIHAFERGMEFEQEVEVIRGMTTIDEYRCYDNWDWECPMPGLGG